MMGTGGADRRDGRPKVLIFAFACRPERGSEPGAGWGLVQAVSSFADCTVLVDYRHMRYIRSWEARQPPDRLEAGPRFIGISYSEWADLVSWNRIGWFLLYLYWLLKALRVARALLREQRFDAVHHATYSAYWLPTPIARLGPPSIWGPVGGAVVTPRPLWRYLGWKGLMTELLDVAAVRVVSRLPATRRSWSEVSLPIAQNDETLERLPPRVRARTKVLNHSLFTEAPDGSVEGAPSDYVVWLSPLESRKGPSLALQALARAPDGIRMLLIGDGPERKALIRRAERLGLSDRVEFRGRVPHEAVAGLFRDAAAAIFTGLREEGGIALAEAMLSGVPVVVLANGGAKVIASWALDHSRVSLIPPGSPDETAEAMGRAIGHFVQHPIHRRAPNLDQTAALRALHAHFVEAISASSHIDLADG